MDTTARDDKPDDREQAHLLVCHAQSSSIVPLPRDGDMLVGSGERASLRLHDEGVAPLHARLSVSDGELTIQRVEGGGLTCVNDEPVDGPRLLVSGDVIGVGGTTLVLHDRAGRVGTRRAVDPNHLRARLREETERCLRNRLSLAVLVVSLGDEDAGVGERAVETVFGIVRFVDIVGWGGGSEIVIVLPETAEAAAAPAGRILKALQPLAARARIGLALCPSDALDVDSLITGARSAARGAAPGGLATVAAHVRPVLAGEHAILTVDPAMTGILALVERLAKSEMPVLVTGETGTGKELIAVALHEWSARRVRPMVAINCAAIAETLFESELFGHERGAFTDAVSAKPGLLETAAGGTILLDEIAECSLRAQAKLLRVLETKRFSRVGSVSERAVDVRIVASTNRNLEQEVAAQRFRQDLFFRLVSASVILPPLRDRPLDIPILARAFLDRASAREARRPMAISAEASRRLCLHEWPGNVRELKNLMDFCAAAVESDVLEAAHLPEQIARSRAPWLSPGTGRPSPPPTGGAASPFERPGGRRYGGIQEEVRELEVTRMRQALAATDGVRVRAAQLLGMPLRTFVTKLKGYGIDLPRGRRPPSGRDGPRGPDG